MRHNKARQILAALLSGLLAVLPPQAVAQQYKILPGDTLSAIAERFDMTVEGLMAANFLEDADRIFAGTTLRIPNATRVRIKKGDTLSAIAQRNDTTVAELMKLNGLGDASLRAGEFILLPNRPLQSSAAPQSSARDWASLRQETERAFLTVGKTPSRKEIAELRRRIASGDIDVTESGGSYSFKDPKGLYSGEAVPGGGGYTVHFGSNKTLVVSDKSELIEEMSAAARITELAAEFDRYEGMADQLLGLKKPFSHTAKRPTVEPYETRWNDNFSRGNEIREIHINEGVRPAHTFEAPHFFARPTGR